MDSRGGSRQYGRGGHPVSEFKVHAVKTPWVKQSRKFQALLAWGAFFVIAQLYALIAGSPVDGRRVAFWSGLGVASYIALSHAFGFDPYRTKVARFAPPMVRYVDRWELRLGQATLAMLGLVVLTARFIDSSNFVTAVVSGTLAAWTYFVLRLYVGGYEASARSAR